MDYFGLSTYSLNDASASAGAQVAAFLTSADAKAESNALLRGQDAVLSAISGVVNEPVAASASVQAAAETAEMELVAQRTTLINAVAVKVPYGKLDEIRNLDGVKRAYVERTFAVPDEPVTDAGAIAGYSYDMVGVQAAWNAGYTGRGMLVAVLDTGLDLNWQAYADPHIVSVHEAFTENSFKSADAKDCLRYNSASLESFLKANTLNAEFRGGETELTYDYNALYKNAKVPFAYDYAELDLNVLPSDSDHGTHVSGTIAGYAADSEGAVKFSGVAPDAQILSMKVFPDSGGGAKESDTISALEDAMKLGADVINLSLGSDNGFAEDDTAQEELYDTVRAAGVLLMTSAGNADDSDYMNNYGGNNLTADPEVSMMSSPAVYDSNLAVASINNTVDVQTIFTWTDAEDEEQEVVYADANTPSMKYKFAGKEPVSIIPVGGTGTYSDYYNAGFRSYYGYGGEKGVSGIALVQRGEISFVDKIKNAESFYWSYYDSALGYYVNECPVKAVIVYDNVEGSLVFMSTEGTNLTSAFISKADGEAIVAAVEAGHDVKISVKEEDNVVVWDQAYEMSEFTSWGAGPGLELKPEITAPGGNIRSTVTGGSSADGSTGSYGMMSGTSMAAPHMTGIAALVEQYVHSKGLVSKQADADLTEQLLVSTAVPQTEDTTYYSPRRQGAGLVNAAAAITTPAYITVGGQRVGKLELKDDPGKTGSYEFEFTVNNMTFDSLSYNVKAVLMRPAVAGDVTLDNDVLIREVDLGTVTVPGRTTGAFSSAAVSKTVSLTDAEKAELDGLFENGTYVEGFIILTDANGSNPQLGLPFLAFYGDWTAAPIFDRATWIDEMGEDEAFWDAACTWWPSIMGYFDGYSFYNLGQNPFDSFAPAQQGEYFEENITISPTGVFKSINDYELYQLREAKLMVVEVRNKETNELYYRDFATYQFKTYYDYNNAWPIPSSLYYFTDTDWDGTDLEGNVLPSGTQCVYTITAYGEGEYPLTADGHTDVEAIHPGQTEPTFNGHVMDSTGDVISFDVMVDTEAPKLVDNAVTIYEEDGHTYMTGTFEDEGSIAAVEIVPQVKRTYKEGYGDPSYAEYGLDLNNPFLCEYVYDADVDTFRFTADVTAYAHTNESYAGENYYYDFTWTGNVFVFGGDYGGNERSYAVTVDTTPGLILSQTSALLYVGDEFDLSVNNNTDSATPVTRTSTNPEVASVDEFGHIVALAPGQTTIVVSNGVSESVCIVAVQERPTEVLDFDLSIDHFSTLTPAGEIVVKVTNLQPADVELTEIRWEVSEDEETAENYEGLVNCDKYTSDGLSGLIYLNYSAYDPYNQGEQTNPPIPAGSGTLTVTLNGVKRTMTLDWEALYKTNSDDDLISDLYGSQQTVYVTQGETATLIARYKEVSAHSALPVKLYTLENSYNYGYSNPEVEAKGLILDGAPTVGTGAQWTGRLVNEEGYALPETIQVGTRYDYGYEYWWMNSEYYSYYSYDSTTGEIVVYAAPYGDTNTLVIRADGVVSEGNPAGELSGNEYETPEALYGPFTWTVIDGDGALTTEESVIVDGYTKKNIAKYTPAEPGVSYLKATSKDGKYSVDFAVISEPVKATKLDLDVHSLALKVGETGTLVPEYTPEPSLQSDKELIWTSFNPKVATVDANGVVTGVTPGYAFVKVCLKTNTRVLSYCVVSVEAEPVPEVYYTVSFNSMGGTAVASQTVLSGAHAAAPADPTRAGYTFEGWYTDGSYENRFDFGAPVTADVTLYAKWSKTAVVEPDPTPVLPPVTPIAPSKPAEPAPEKKATFVDVPTSHWAYDAVQTVVDLGLFNGVSANKFDPSGEMTRAMLVTVLWRLENKPAAAFTGTFADVKSGQYYTTAVEWALANGVVNGVSPVSFAPDSVVTREQIAAILWRLEGSPVVSGDLSRFHDGNTVSGYAKQAMIWAVSVGLFSGDASGNLRPTAAASRAEVATLMCRYVEKFR